MTTSFSSHPDSPAQTPQSELALTSPTMTALDLFCGIGGFSVGFRDKGFSLLGVDHEPVAKAVYESAGFGKALTLDLSTEPYVCDVPVVLGGPPCRPWSAVNLKRRRADHDDHALLNQFFTNVLAIRPVIMLMENVPAVGSDRAYLDGLGRLRANGYDVARGILRYDRFGAATRRKRLFTVAIHGTRVGGKTFFKLLLERHRPASTVGHAIEWLRNKGEGDVADHDWSRLRTIGNYRHLYKSGKYGWTKLRYDEPAPSFGSVAKTYILHPEAGVGLFPERVVSVREVMAIMGFDISVAFPPRTPRAKRYQMVANAVSPDVSREVAEVVRCLLPGLPRRPASSPLLVETPEA